MELFTCIFILYNAVLCRYFQWRWIQIHFPFFLDIYTVLCRFFRVRVDVTMFFLLRGLGGGGVGITLCLVYSEGFFWGGVVFYCRCFVLVAAASVNFIRGEHSIGFTIKYIHVHVNTWVINTLIKTQKKSNIYLNAL